jgi:hypothetical protein
MKPDDSEIIELNVGGFTYTTSRTTILSYPDTMLCKMISGQLPSATDIKQRIFIDRDGPLFRYILNFLRDKRLNLPENFSEYAQLRQEADFYRIEPILNYLDCVYSGKLGLGGRNSMSGSLTSLVSTTETILSSAATANNASRPLFFTIISKLHQGSIESIVGCIKILAVFSSLDSNSKRFMNNLLTPSSSSSSNSSSSSLIGNSQLLNSFVCEFKFMHEEKLICCKPCGLTSSTDVNLVNLCQAIVRLAKKYGITTGYWDDMFYLTLESSVTNREQLCSILGDKSNAKLLSSCICDRRSSYDENATSTLIERWQVMSNDLTK